jgi:hypothetical protein
MGQRWRRNYAALRDVPIKYGAEEFVSRMVQQRSVKNNAILRDVPIESRREEFVSRMARR